jgi:hypothetical protein
MRVNVYAEELTNVVELIKKTSEEGIEFIGIRFHLELPVTDYNGIQHRGPFIHSPGDDDSSAVTFWGKQSLRPLLSAAILLLDNHYNKERNKIKENFNKVGE